MPPTTAPLQLTIVVFPVLTTGTQELGPRSVSCVRWESISPKAAQSVSTARPENSSETMVASNANSVAMNQTQVLSPAVSAIQASPPSV